MCNVLYPGSFDPFTNGHLNVLKHASSIFDKVYICVTSNPQKKRFIPIETSEELIEQIIRNRCSNVEVVRSHTNLLYKQAKICNCAYIVRGVRNNGIDYPYEENLAKFNKDIGDIDTIFIRSDSIISSTMVRILLANDENIVDYVPKEIYEYFKKGKL